MFYQQAANQHVLLAHVLIADCCSEGSRIKRDLEMARRRDAIPVESERRPAFVVPSIGYAYGIGV